jgi:hypothetical protein
MGPNSNTASGTDIAIFRYPRLRFAQPQQVAEDLQTYFCWVTLVFQQCRRQAAKQANTRRPQ